MGKNRRNVWPDNDPRYGGGTVEADEEGEPVRKKARLPPGPDAPEGIGEGAGGAAGSNESGGGALVPAQRRPVAVPDHWKIYAPKESERKELALFKQKCGLCVYLWFRAQERPYWPTDRVLLQRVYLGGPTWTVYPIRGAFPADKNADSEESELKEFAMQLVGEQTGIVLQPADINIRAEFPEKLIGGDILVQVCLQDNAGQFLTFGKQAPVNWMQQTTVQHVSEGFRSLCTPWQALFPEIYHDARCVFRMQKPEADYQEEEIELEEKKVMGRIMH